MDPSYDFEEFRAICREKSNITITRGAMETARNDLKLNTKENVLNFIASGGLEKIKLIHSVIWENNPKPENKIMVDSYDFYSGNLYGYLAFLCNNKQWIIKSFKKNTEIDTRNMPFQNLEKTLKRFLGDKSWRN